MGQVVGRRGTRVVVAGLLIVATVAAVSSTGGAEPAPPLVSQGGIQAYRGVVDADGMASIVAMGVDRHEVIVTSAPDANGDIGVEVILSESQAAELVADGRSS